MQVRLGAIAFIISVVCIITGFSIISLGLYSPLFSDKANATAICRQHRGYLGQAPDTACGVLQNGVCRRGKVGPNSKECIADSEMLGRGLVVGGIVSFLVGIVALLLSEKPANKKKGRSNKAPDT